MSVVSIAHQRWQKATSYDFGAESLKKRIIEFSLQAFRNRMMDHKLGKAAVGHPDDTAADRDQKIKVADELRQKLEALALMARDLILAQPPIRFLGYVLMQFHMSMLYQNNNGDAENLHRSRILNKYQILLEHMHAVWSCNIHLVEGDQSIDEDKAT